MSTLVLVRHGRTHANVAGTLAGWIDGVFLDETGAEQAHAVAERLAVLPLTAIVASPLDRAQQTADVIEAAQSRSVSRHTDAAFGEVDYGDWSGRQLSELATEDLWLQVQHHPASVTFPSGESLADMQTRAVRAVRAWNDRLGDDATYAVVSHGDVIKAILADALGLHLDLFQRISVDPCSVSIIRYTVQRPFVVRINDAGCDLGSLRPPAASASSSDAIVGGGA